MVITIGTDKKLVKVKASTILYKIHYKNRNKVIERGLNIIRR